MRRGNEGRVRLGLGVLLGLCLALTPVEAEAFCGFFVASAGADLYNETSQVAVVREGERTVMNLQFNYKGEPSEFALVLPVPVVLGEKDVRVIRPELFEKLDAYSAPRLVDYPPEDPCRKKRPRRTRRSSGKKKSRKSDDAKVVEEDLGVTVEAQFEVEEYEIVILSAKESNGLETWLNREGYAIPEGSAPFYTPYIERGMYFFVVRVNLEKLASIALPKDDKGYQTLRPLQFEFESEGFMLPIQLGKINAVDEQHLVLYVISPDGRFKVSNYRNVEIPTNLHVDTAFKQQPSAFQKLYRDLTSAAAARAEEEAVLTEYVWKISKCDPCPTQPPRAEELAELGAHIHTTRRRRVRRSRPNRLEDKIPIFDNNPSGDTHNYYDYVVTRFRASYPPDAFEKDLTFELDTEGSTRFQGRYIMQFPFEGETPCLEEEARLDLVKKFKLAPANEAERAALAAAKKNPDVWAEAWLASGIVPDGGSPALPEKIGQEGQSPRRSKRSGAAPSGEGAGAGGAAGAADADAAAAAPTPSEGATGAAAQGGAAPADATSGGGGGSSQQQPSALCSTLPRRAPTPLSWPLGGGALVAAACALSLARRR